MPLIIDFPPQRGLHLLQGFLDRCEVLLWCSIKEYIVGPEANPGNEPAVSDLPRPRIGTWVWSPWYAKVWWLCIALYWGGRAISLYNERLDSFYTGTIAAYFNLAFMPMAPFLILGIGFAWSWMDHHGLEFGPPDGDYVPPKRSVGGWLDPMSDPLDPRSPKYWQKRRSH